MFSVYGLLCNGLRDPRAVTKPCTLTWRLGSDRVGAFQKTVRVVVVSLSTGEVAWDTGTVCTSATTLEYDGPTLSAGEWCSWFVTVCDDAGEEAQSAPAAFRWGSAGDVAHSDLGAECQSFIWTSSSTANAELERLDGIDPDDAWWTQVLGVRVLSDHVRVEPHFPTDLLFVRGTLLLPGGLLLLHAERTDAGLRVELTLPPGLRGSIHANGTCTLVGSGHHVVGA